MLKFAELKKNLKKDAGHLKTIKVAILGDSSTQLLATAIRGYGIEQEYNIEVFDSPYDQIKQQILNYSSDLYLFKPDFVIVCNSHVKLQNTFYKLSKVERIEFADSQIEEIERLLSALRENISCNVIYFNFPETGDPVFGSYGNKIPVSYIYQLRKLNYGLMRLGEKHNNVHIADLAAMYSRVGRSFAFTSSLYVTSDIVYNFDLLPHLAKSIVDIVKAVNGKIVKCVILDLDNTLWGGIIGDDGIENIELGNLGIGKAFTEFQLWLKQLKDRGVILAVCSKNDEAIARYAFENHPEMVLKIDDIAIFVANWENKADNITYIKEFLNIGYDSIVFLDDSQFERNIVRNNLTGVIVPELPEDPADYLDYIQSLNLFETASYTSEDEHRTQLYKEDFVRKEIKRSFIDEDDYLRNLGLNVTHVPFDDYNIPRITQLIQRSNQFNLRTVRYSEEQLMKIAADEDYLCYAFSLEDKYGKYGLISTIILKRDDEILFFDTWVMSCRVLNRGLEKYVLNYIVKMAAAKNITYLVGEYIPTAKNGLVKDHYRSLGFKCRDGRWYLEVRLFDNLKHFITSSKETDTNFQ